METSQPKRKFKDFKEVKEPLFISNAEAYKRWYAHHHEEFNRKRKEKYDSDPEFRKRLVERQRKYRLSKAPQVEKGRFFKTWNFERVEVFRIGRVAKMIGRSIQTIRLWEQAKRIPTPLFETQHRHYTLHQVNLLREYAEVSSSVRWSPGVREEKCKEKSEEIYAQWAGEIK